MFDTLNKEKAHFKKTLKEFLNKQEKALQQVAAKNIFALILSINDKRRRSIPYRKPQQ